MARWLRVVAVLFLPATLVSGQVQYGAATRHEGRGTEVKVSVPASAGGTGTYCFQVRAIGKVGETEVPSQWSVPHCAPLTPPVTVTLAWDAASAPAPAGGRTWVHSAYEVRLGLAPAPTASNVAAPKNSESLFADRQPGQEYKEATAYELGARFVSTRSGRVMALRFFKSANETGRHTGRVWSASGQLLAEVAFENETPSGWQEQRLPTPIPVKAGTRFVISVTTDANGNYAVTPDDLRRPQSRGSLRAEGAVFGPLGEFPRTRRPDNFFRDVVFVSDP